jgi:hypothetical protein
MSSVTTTDTSQSDEPPSLLVHNASVAFERMFATVVVSVDVFVAEPSEFHSR